MSAASEMMRKMCSECDNKRDEGLTTPEGVKRYDDIVYGTSEKEQVLDVYRPIDISGNLPVIVSVHGGGWVYGDKERYQYYCMSLAMQGFAVVNFTYRLAPENKFPASLEDTNLVFHWILDHAEEYGFDTEHIFAVGDSAGAHNLGLYTAICTNKDYASTYSFLPPKDFVPKAIALNCGAYQIEIEGEENTSTKELMGELLPQKGSEAELEKICVIRHITENFPPVFFMTSTGDFLKNQALLLAAKLTECNVPFTYRLYGDSKKQLSHVFHCDMKSQDAKKCNEEECQFFMKFF